MKIYTSYFYQIRNFPKNLVPLSTALSDPRYYHDFKHPHYYFVDKRGIVNGLRAEPFMPGVECSGLCHGPNDCSGKAKTCAFLQTYYKQLCKLDINDIMFRFQDLGKRLVAAGVLNELPNFALIVHEAPTNPCSERGPIQQYFKNNGIIVQEFEPNN